MKKLIIAAFTAALFFAQTSVAVYAAAATTIYESKEETTLTKGVTYYKINQVTDAGLRDVYMLKLPLNDPNILLSVAESKTEPSLKEAASKLLNDNGAIAGVNGDFFGMAGKYSASFGAVFKEGKLSSVTAGNNKDANNYAGLFIGVENNPFIMYLKTEIEFLNDGKKNITVHSINKVTDMVYPVIVNQELMTNTKTVDERFKNVVKVVVQDDKIIYVSKQGETVDVPENGYVLLISEASAGYFTQFYKVGQTAEIKFRSGLDFSQIKMAVGGGGRLLLEGELVAPNTLVAKGRQPRTAVGISKDKTQAIIMVVDGRTHSIGATHEEMAALMKKYGAFNAMHLDGGGSTTMAVKTTEQDYATVVNTVSEGAQRNIINALGVYNKSQVGELVKLVVEAESDKVLVGVPTKISIYGVDSYLNKIDVPMEQIVLSTYEEEGTWKDGYFTPKKAGEIYIVAVKDEVVGDLYLTSKNLVELVPSIKTIKLSKDDKASISFSGITPNGENFPITSGVSYEIVPETLGNMEGGTFVASGQGNGYIKATVGDISTYIDVYLGEKSVAIHDFEGSNKLEFIGFPKETVTGAAGFSTKEKTDGAKSVEMTYRFATSSATQAAYLAFSSPIAIGGTPTALTLSVYGNDSKLWLRGKIKDASDKEFTIDFAKSIDWNGFKTVKAKIPQDVKFPIRLERIYLASLFADTEINGSIYLDSLSGIYVTEAQKVQLPDAPKFVDPTKANLQNAPKDGQFDITVIGDTTIEMKEKPKNYEDVKKGLIKQISDNSRRALYAGVTDLPLDIAVKVYSWNPNYIMHAQDNVAIIQMSAEKGGLIATKPWQWAKFKADIENSGKDHVIIEIDKSPLNWATKQEFELFQDALLKLGETGKNIFVVSTENGKTSDVNKNGVHYINLGNVWNADGTINESFKMLRLRISGKDVSYELQALK